MMFMAVIILEVDMSIGIWNMSSDVEKIKPQHINLYCTQNVFHDFSYSLSDTKKAV